MGVNPGVITDSDGTKQKIKTGRTEIVVARTKVNALRKADAITKVIKARLLSQASSANQHAWLVQAPGKFHAETGLNAQPCRCVPRKHEEAVPARQSRVTSGCSGVENRGKTREYEPAKAHLDTNLTGCGSSQVAGSCRRSRFKSRQLPLNQIQYGHRQRHTPFKEDYLSRNAEINNHCEPPRASN